MSGEKTGKVRTVKITVQVTSVQISNGEFQERVKMLLDKNREMIRYLAKK
ncbi:MAG: hypothetical protein WC488_04035 [Candidatus Micrarchaeia archaeon]